ncbi:MAG: PAS domain S-box protein [Gammaproteobacteria bacterium]|nr:PAS domain S-box protein [Gammaproteobacteria bacterium]
MDVLVKHQRALQTIFPQFDATNLVGKNIDQFHKNPSHQRQFLSKPSNLPFKTDINVGPLVFELHISAVMDSNGQYSGNFLEWLDVTEIRLSEEKNIDFSSQISAINKSQAVVEFNMDGTVITANDNFLNIMGYTLSEIQGQHHSMFVDPSFRETTDYRQFWDRLNRGEYEASEYKRIGKHGKEVWIQASYNAIVDANNKPFKVVKYASDITAKKLKNSDYVGQIEAISKLQAVIEFNLDGTIITANDNFLNTMGYCLEDIKGQHHRIFVDSKYSNSDEYRQFWEKLNRGESDVAEYLRIGKGNKEVWIQASYNPIFDSNGKAFKIVKYATDITEQKNAEREVASMISAASQGDLNERIDVAQYSGYLKSLAEGVNHLVNAVVRPIRESNRVVSALSTGDLRENMQGEFSGEYAEMQESLNLTVVNLRDMVGKIQMSSESIVSAAGEIAEGNADLSRRTEEQASSLEETASSMEELTSTVRQNADNARQANQLASGAKELAEKGGKVVKQAVVAMSEINASSKKIADIIGVIDEIAFQTNLLALNAAVEAARAGEQGRGFAVVAGEVRNLAQRSAGAAKEIKMLIQDSVSKVDDGSRLVDRSGKTLDEIVGSVKKVSNIIAEIATASQEQSKGIDQVNKAVSQMDEVTQQNAALVEEAAAASESMDEQARSLQGLMDFFTINDGASPLG